MRKHVPLLMVSMAAIWFVICAIRAGAQSHGSAPLQTNGSVNVADEMPFARMMQSDMELLMEFQAELMCSVVKDLPFSAQLSLETEQLLGDGTRIARKTGGSIYRDSSGRLREELTMPVPSPASVPTDIGIMVILYDPSLGAHWILMPAAKAAMKMTMPTAPKGKGNADSNAEENLRTFGGFENGGTAEKLGAQNVEGVTATGTRYTHTVPAGQLGNDQPLQLITERWYSSEMRMTVSLKRSDPMTGSKILKLMEIRQQQPDAALFSVPADYQVKEMTIPADTQLKKPSQP